MSRIFIDSSFVLAMEFGHDQNHRAAIDCWMAFRTTNRSTLTTSFVLDEVVTHLNSRGHHGRAVVVGNRLMADSESFVHVGPDLLNRGWAYFCRHADKRYSLTDCISFVVMQERELRQALTFDLHFTQAGFEALPFVPA